MSCPCSETSNDFSLHLKESLNSMPRPLRCYGTRLLPASSWLSCPPSLYSPGSTCCFNLPAHTYLCRASAPPKGSCTLFCDRLGQVAGKSIHRNMSPPWNTTLFLIRETIPGQILKLGCWFSLRSTGSRIFSSLILGSGIILSLHLYPHCLIYFSIILYSFLM